MNLSAPFILRPIMTTLLAVALVFAGVLAYINLPISNMPDVTYPTINVSVSYPGATPETMAQAVALPLEKQFMAIPGVKFVGSNNTLGSSSIVLQFDIEKDMTIAAQDVQSAIITAQPTLPPQLPYAPTYRKVNPAELPIIYISLTSETMRLNDLYTYANNLIGQRISMLSGVSQVTVFGSPLAIRIQVDPARMVASDITLEELAIAMSLGNPNLPTGELDGAIEAPNVAVDGQIVTGEGWNQLIVAYRNGTPLRIKDLGQAVESFQNDKINVQYVDADGARPTILLAIQKEPNANTVAISDQIHALLDTLKTELPAAVTLKPFFDRSESIRETISDVNMTLILAIALVVVVIFLYFGKIADTIIPAVVLPISIVGTFIVMNYLGFTLNNLSLLGLILAVGFIIDDAIVVLENIVRHQEQGMSRFNAAIEGARQICFTIVSMTLSLVAVFIPMLLMSGLLGKILREFALTLTAITVISGIVSLSLAPMLCSRFLSVTQHKGKLTQWGDKVNLRMRERYRKMLIPVLDHEYMALFVGAACLLATIFLFYYLPIDFLPDEDDGFFIAYTQTQEAGSSYQLLEYEKQVMNIIKENPAVESSVAISSYSEYRKGQNLIRLKPLTKRLPIKEVIKELNQQIGKIPGIQVFMKNIPLIDLSTGQESRGDYQLAMQSIYPDKVYASAKKLISRMQGDPTFQGVNSDLEIDSPQINVNILRDQASSYGITATDIETAFMHSYSYNYVTRIETAIDQYDIILELLPEQQKSADTFNFLWMRSSISNKLVPMSAAAKWSEGLGPSSVNHIDQFPSVTIDFNLASGVSLGDGLDRLEELKQEVVEPGVLVQSIGAIETFQESISSAGILLLVSIFVIYIILGMLYESFIHPLTVLSTLPPATLGGLLVLLLFGLPLSMYAFLGIVLLIGIVKKNGIMMVDFALENIRSREMNSKDAIIDACMVRFRPIMMTTMAAIFGALPIAIGIGANAGARRPLGLVIIGGLLLSQLITLFITPVIYVMMDRLSPGKERG
ncbi:MAG: efflux RND transporter permease subunit [Parachlamydiaceae bacterium]